MKKAAGGSDEAVPAEQPAKSDDSGTVSKTGDAEVKDPNATPEMDFDLGGKTIIVVSWWDKYDYLYSVYYSQWIDLAEQMYHDVNKLLTKVRNRQIVSHRKLEDGVYRTGYENGVYVIVNSNFAVNKW